MSFAAIGVGVARYAVLGGRPRKLIVIARPSREVVRLPRIDATSRPATFGLEDEQGSLAVVGQVVALAPEHVDRRIDPNARISEGDSVRLAGNVFGPESPLARSATEVSWKGPAFTHRVWDFSPDGADGKLWFVHVHGLGASPAGILRSVDAANQLGHRSTVVSLDGNPDMFARVRGVRASALERVIAAIDRARSLGATWVALVGWSFGGQLAIQAADRAEVAALVLVSPTIDLLATVRSEASARGIPRFVATLGIAVLTSPGLSRLARVDRPLERTPNHLGTRTQSPVLLLRSAGDHTLSLTDLVSSEGADHVSLIEFPAAPHTMEWNADPALFVRELDRWLIALRLET